MTIATAAPARLRRGMTFRTTIGDSRPEFELLSSQSGSWLCVGTEDAMDGPDGARIESEYAGAQRAFTREHILAELHWADALRASIAASGKWWATRAVGSTVHYHDSFNQFVRGIVAVDADGNVGMRPVALVGAWAPVRLPRRLADGSIHNDYWARRIDAGDLWCPHESNVFESPTFHRRGVDPRDALPIDLTIPEPTAAEQAAINRERALQRVREIATEPRSAQERMDAIRTVLSEFE